MNTFFFFLNTNRIALTVCIQLVESLYPWNSRSCEPNGLLALLAISCLRLYTSGWTHTVGFCQSSKEPSLVLFLNVFCLYFAASVVIGDRERAVPTRSFTPSDKIKKTMIHGAYRAFRDCVRRKNDGADQKKSAAFTYSKRQDPSRAKRLTSSCYI